MVKEIRSEQDIHVRGDTAESRHAKVAILVSDTLLQCRGIVSWSRTEIHVRHFSNI